MLSSGDLETLIASKKREIEREKTLLGLLSPPDDSTAQEDKENGQPFKSKKQVNFKDNYVQAEKLNKESKILYDQQNETSTGSKEVDQKALYEHEETIPPDLERYIRRYIGIPGMLKAGEYSPNNPLLRAERASGVGDALLGLGEYERRRNTLRKIRQAQYRQYLDQQANKKQEAKEQAERERREREEKERQREERERQLLLERDRYSPERRRASVSSVPISTALVQTTKVDTGVQVDGLTRPLSVAVQTDDVELYRLTPSPSKCLTQAERELSPRTVAEPRDAWDRKWEASERRRSYGDYDERTSSIKESNRDKLVSDLRHSYMPSILDADGIQMRNVQAEKEAAARRQFYQQELKNQILEQQRIREERKTREKMLEQAEMRRLEEQLRMLRGAQDRERDKHHELTAAMKDNSRDYESKRTELQREIDLEQQKVMRAGSQPTRSRPQRVTETSKSDTPRSKLPFYYPQNENYQEKDKKPYSFNIPDNSVFSANYDVDSYLRKNLNFRDKMELNIENIGNNNKPVEKHKDAQGNSTTSFEKYKDVQGKSTTSFENYKDVQGHSNMFFEKQKNAQGNSNKSSEKPKDVQGNNNLYDKHKDVQRNIVVEKALVHEPKVNRLKEKTFQEIDDISIPVLRHSPKSQLVTNESPTYLSEAMKKIDDKWKVPAVQKNILKSLPNEDGKNISILTQLGSIRRQLQLEQLKLDKMLSKDDS